MTADDGGGAVPPAGASLEKIEMLSKRRRGAEAALAPASCLFFPANQTIINIKGGFAAGRKEAARWES